MIHDTLVTTVIYLSVLPNNILDSIILAPSGSMCYRSGISSH